ncbi:MAG: polyhydroxyalkanoate synthesis regulator DNA-binding domain-containing protein [Bdellovibrionales bacterium]
MNHEQDQRLMMNPPASRAKIVKRYQNRKLYDTQQSCYVTLDDIAKMIRADEQVIVIDNKTKNDITAATLTQIIFEAEKKAAQYAPLKTLREVIQHKNGSISAYLAKLGAFPMEEYENQKPQRVDLPQNNSGSTRRGEDSFETMKQTLEKRVASAAVSMGVGSSLDPDSESYIEILPNLPNPNNRNFEPSK